MSASRMRSSLAVIAAVLQGVSMAVPAQQGAIEEVVVTAQKREQSLQDVPISVSAYGERFMNDLGVKDFRDIVDITPGLAGRTEDSFNDALSVRGISTNDFGVGGDPSVAIFVDGFYEGRTGGAITSMLDMARAEVVKGPQGTLFGRNAIAGAISMTTNKPEEEFGGRLAAAIEEYDHYEVTGTVNVPLTDRVYARATYHHLEDDGYLKNLAGGKRLGGHNRDAFQGSIRYAGDSLDATVLGFYEDRKSTSSVYWRKLDGLPEDRVNIDLGDDSDDEGEIFKVVANIDYQLDNGYSVSAIGGYKGYEYSYIEDYDAGPTTVDNYLQDQDVNYWSGELRLNSPTDGNVVWFVGVSGYREEVDANFANIYTEDDLCRAMVQTEVGDVTSPDDFTWAEGTTVTGCDDPLFELVWGDDIDPADLLENKAERNFNSGDYWGWAAYFDVTWSVTDRIDLIAGLRYTYDEKDYGIWVPDSGGALGNNFAFEFFTNGFVRDEQNWDDFTPRFAANFRWTDDISLYTTVAYGYKSGGFATFGLDPSGTRPKTFNPEKVFSVEGGVKARWMDGRLSTNLSIYDYSYDDLQLVYFTGGSSQVDNVAEASGFGSELEVRFRPVDSIDLLVTAGYLDTEIDKVDQSFLDEGGCDNCAGNDLWFSPEWTVSFIGTYHHPVSWGGEVYLSVEHHYEGEKFAGPDNLELAKTDSWNEVNLQLGYHSDASWSATLYVNNVFDEEYFERGWENADADDLYGYGLHNTLVWPSKPRFVGFKVEYEF